MNYKITYIFIFFSFLFPVCSLYAQKKEFKKADYLFRQLAYKEAAKELKFIVRSKPMMSGRIELLNFFEEQSISHSYHRYGNLGGRVLEDEQK